MLTSAGLNARPVYHFGQRTAESEVRLRGARLLAPVENAPVRVLLGQPRQPIDVEIDLRWSSFRKGMVGMRSVSGII